jgi:uncharacterized membrane protein
MITKRKKEDLYNKYLQKIKRNYILKRVLKFFFGLVFTIIFLFIFYEYKIFIVLLCVLLGLTLLCIGLFDPGNHQLKKRNKDFDKLRFEYQEYLERKKTRENHSGGELIMDYCCDYRFKFD